MKSTATSAVLYTRVSTTKQAEEGVSLEAQEARLRSWAAGQGIEVAGVHVDAGLSGGRADNRPGLQAALADVCKRRGVLVVYSLSRVARSTRDALAIAERLEKAGADLVSLSEAIDTTSAAGKMVFRMLAVLAEFERVLISERTLSAMDHLRRQGRKVSGNIPFGFDETEGGRLVPNEREQEVLALIRKMRDGGASFRDIVRELEVASVPTKSGLLTWTPATIRGVLLRDERLRMAA
jgi:DNA invertase Pin-like site-specific DNA recombinase